MLKDHLNNLKRKIIHPFHFGNYIIFLIIFIGVFSTQIAFARLWNNSYVSFELPNRWDCHLKQTEWICEGKEQTKREAVIILTAKEVGVQDSLDQYTTYLNRPKSIVSPRGKPLLSRGVYTREKKYNQHKWIDSLHENSEVPNFYTRYLATTKKNIAILVTFTSKKSLFTKYESAFQKAVKSLRVIAPDSLLNDPSGYNLAGAGGAVGGSVQSAFPLDLYDEGLPDEPTAKQRRMKKLFMLLLLSIGGIGAYLFFTREKDA